MIEFKEINIDGVEYSMLQCQERRDYFDDSQNYDNSMSLLTLIQQYCNTIIPTVKPSDIDITRSLIGDNCNIPYNVVLQNCAIAMKEYIEEYILKQLNQDNVGRFKDKITYLAIDFEYFCYDAERECKGTDLKPMKPTAGRRSCLSDFDIKMTLKSLFYFETVEKVEHVQNSDMHTVAIAMLRLYIDRALLNALPYKKIIKQNNGKEVKMTGLRREFLKELYENGDAVLLNRDYAETLVLAYSWCCDAVHYGALPYEFISDWTIMHVIKQEKLFNDTAAMKTRFDAFLTTKIRSNCSVEW